MAPRRTFVPDGKIRRGFLFEGGDLMGDILKQLSDYAKVRVKEAKQAVSLANMEYAAFSMPCNTGYPFRKALMTEGMSFICECKKASPSKGLIAEEFPYVKIAKEYEEAGAAAISVLTEPKWFLGSLQYLKEIHEAVRIPLLRKDFTVDEYMIFEAKVYGASAVLLIVSILDEKQLRSYLELTERLGLDALVEAHDETEIQTALNAGAKIIGVNNRNLHDFTVDIHNSSRLRDRVPENILFVAESGIRTRGDIEVLEQGKINGVLIGESLMRAENKKQMLDELKGIRGENR